MELYSSPGEIGSFSPMKTEEGEDNRPRTHTLIVQGTYFDSIREGKKTVEGRAGKVDGKKIQENYKEQKSAYKTGDMIKFTTDDKPDTIVCTITKVVFYTTFEAMLQESGLNNCLPGFQSIEEGVKVYRAFEGYESRELQFGVIAIHIELNKVARPINL